MPAYLGARGALVPLPRVVVSEVTPKRGMTFQETLGGQIMVQRGPSSRREWRVRTNGFLTGPEAASFQALIEAGTPPWVWAEPYAQVTNLFTPEQSTLAPGCWSGSGVTDGGAVTVGGVTVPRSVLHPSGGTVTLGLRRGSAEHPPVVPGVPVSASVCARGDGALSLHWLDWQGNSLGSETQAYSNSTVAPVQITDRMSPTGAVSARLTVTGMRQAAMPCITWTPEAPEWSMGRGCTRAITEGLPESVQAADRNDSSLRRSSLSFTVKEVG